MPLPISAYLDMAFDFLPVGVGLTRRGSWRGGAAILFWFVMLGMFVEMVTYLMGRRGINNLWVLHIYALMEYVILILLFADWQKEAGRPLLRRLLYASIGIYTLFWIVAKLEFESFKRFDQYTHSISALVFVAISLFTLIDLVRNEALSMNAVVPIYQTFKFWALVGVLIFFSGNTFLFGLGQMITTLAVKDALAVWTIHWWLNITANICYGVGFWYLKRP